jgi:hypothetical protein
MRQAPRKQAIRRGRPAGTAAPRRRRNGASADAAELFETFHGAPSTGYTEYEIPAAHPTDLADLGRLIELSVWVDEDDLQDFRPTSGNVRVACVPVRVAGELIGSQIYFIGGDQAVNLDPLGLADPVLKDHVMIGPCQYIAYHTSKDFHDFKPVDYEHQFGEETGSLPYLGYDTRNKRIYLIGGAYQVKRPGILN